MEHDGNRDRWDEIRARRSNPGDDALEQLAAAVNKVFIKPDPLDAFAAAVSARKPRKGQSGAPDRFLQALDIRDEYIRAGEARRADLERRNGAKARAAFDHYERTRARFAPEREFEPELSPLVAMTMHISPSPLYRIY